MLEPPPDGFASWDAYWRDVGVPEEELGTGSVGLSIVAAIAKAHHANLTINPGPHGGLDIGISFPPAAATSAPQAALATA